MAVPKAISPKTRKAPFWESHYFYARLLELVNDEWDLDPYRRAVNEVTADKLRSIARKYQEAIGYDYEAALAKCEAKQKKQRKDDDVGGDALELAMKRGKRNPKKKEK